MFLIHPATLHLVSIEDSYLNQSLLLWLQNGAFLNPPFSPYLLVLFVCLPLCLSLSVCLSLFIYCHYGLMFLFDSMGYLFPYLFCCSNCSIFVQDGGMGSFQAGYFKTCLYIYSTKNI